MTTDCPGAKSRINPSRPHVLCRQCDRFAFGITDGRTPRLIDDGVATCPDRIHAGTVRQATDSRAHTCGGLDASSVGVSGTTGGAG